MKLSVIIPTLNEKKHIENLIESIDSMDDSEKEILIVDGGSVDGTVEHVHTIAKCRKNVKLVENPEKYVSFGFNRAYEYCSGQYISLVGAHALYPRNYFSVCMDAIESGECDVSGGFLKQRGKSSMGEAIAIAMSSKFGVGNTEFRTEQKRMYVDSVAFAVYSRKVFEECGLLDEDLIRNQDDEFHYRLNRAGFRIMLIPDLEVVYFVRDSLKKLYRQYYQYGLYKPLVIRKVSAGFRLRHVIPTVFTLYLFSLPLSLTTIFWSLPLVLYMLLCIYVGSSANCPRAIKLRIPLVFPVLHFAYGWGFIRGIFKR